MFNAWRPRNWWHLAKLFRLMFVKIGFYVKSSSTKNRAPPLQMYDGRIKFIPENQRKSHIKVASTKRKKTFLRPIIFMLSIKFRIGCFATRKRSKTLNNLWQCEPNSQFTTLRTRIKCCDIWTEQSTSNWRIECKRENVERFYLSMNLNVRCFVSSGGSDGSSNNQRLCSIWIAYSYLNLIATREFNAPDSNENR